MEKFTIKLNAVVKDKNADDEKDLKEIQLQCTHSNQILFYSHIFLKVNSKFQTKLTEINLRRWRNFVTRWWRRRRFFCRFLCFSFSFSYSVASQHQRHQNRQQKRRRRHHRITKFRHRLKLSSVKYKI